VTSSYRDNGMPAGADGTTLQVTGNQFSANSAVTFLLDNTAVKQDMQAESNANGDITANLAVTSAWSIGQHKLIARDANSHTTNNGIAISIVKQGYNGTPGPNGAPTNTASFKVSVDLHIQSGTTVETDAGELNVKGQSDSQGGTVCAPGDDGRRYTNQLTLSNGTTVTRVYTFRCSGTYKDGRISYNEILDTDVYSDAGGSCQLSSPVSSYIQMTGTYTTSHQFSGDIILSSISGSQYTCTGDLTYTGTTAGATGTWTGTVSNQGTNL
jgi:hypothetical protein